MEGEANIMLSRFFFLRIYLDLKLLILQISDQIFFLNEENNQLHLMK